MTSNDNAEPSNAVSAAGKPKEHQEDPQQPRAQAIGSGSEHAQPQPVNHCHNSDQNKKHWLEYATFTVFTLGSIAALFAAGFTFWQAWIAKDTEKRQLRAYLSISVPLNALDNFGEGKTAHVKGIIENMGQTPAYKTTWMAGINVAENTPKIQFAYNDCNMIMSQVDVAEWLVAKQPAFPDKDRTVPFSKKEVDSIESGKAAIYFNGRVCYRDIFEEEQSIDFCIYWDWDRNKNRLHSNGTYCRHGNGPPEKKSTY